MHSPARMHKAISMPYGKTCHRDNRRQAVPCVTTSIAPVNFLPHQTAVAVAVRPKNTSLLWRAHTGTGWHLRYGLRQQQPWYGTCNKPDRARGVGPKHICEEHHPANTATTAQTQVIDPDGSHGHTRHAAKPSSAAVLHRRPCHRSTRAVTGREVCVSRWCLPYVDSEALFVLAKVPPGVHPSVHLIRRPVWVSKSHAYGHIHTHTDVGFCFLLLLC